MKISITDKTERENESLIELIHELAEFTQRKLGYEEPFSVELVSDEDNEMNSLGTTAFYSQPDMCITLHVSGRHDKDILRSLGHEIIHHAQNCRGDLFAAMEAGESGEGYFQTNPHLRKLEAEAYLLGNGLLFREFEESIKEKQKMSKEEVQESAIEQRREDSDLSPELEEGVSHYDEVNEEWVPATESITYDSERSNDLFETLVKRYTGGKING
jgi:hypothetical protein